MKFSNADQVKKWLRLLPVARKEMNAKISFYNQLINDFTRVEYTENEIVRNGLSKNTYKGEINNVHFYRSQIEECKKKYDKLLKDWERLSKLLDSEEITLITEKYLKGNNWDSMEFVMFYSRRQCFRILERAAEKLIGETVGE